jgi:hypothetical protein
MKSDPTIRRDRTKCWLDESNIRRFPSSLRVSLVTRFTECARAKTEAGFPACFLRGESPRQTRIFFMREVGVDLLGEVLILLSLTGKPPHAHVYLPPAHRTIRQG